MSIPTDELKVISSNPYKTEVRLIQSGFGETYYNIYRDSNDTLVYGEVTENGVSHKDSVITIEILGIADT